MATPEKERNKQSRVSSDNNVPSKRQDEQEDDEKKRRKETPEVETEQLSRCPASDPIQAEPQRPHACARQLAMGKPHQTYLTREDETEREITALVAIVSSLSEQPVWSVRKGGNGEAASLFTCLTVSGTCFLRICRTASIRSLPLPSFPIPIPALPDRTTQAQRPRLPPANLTRTTVIPLTPP